jgi:hypothetical protein
VDVQETLEDARLLAKDKRRGVDRRLADFGEEWTSGGEEGRMRPN